MLPVPPVGEPRPMRAFAISLFFAALGCTGPTPGPMKSDASMCVEPSSCNHGRECCSGACFENRCRARCRESLGESCPPGQQCRAVELEPGVLLREVCL